MFSMIVDSTVQHIIKIDDEKWKFSEEIDKGCVYEMPFDGSDAQAQVIEDISGLSFLGEAMQGYQKDKACIVTGNKTKKRVYLARTY